MTDTEDYHIVRAIMHTAAYFSIFQTPLTKEEVYRLLWWDSGAPPARQAVYQCIERGILGMTYANGLLGFSDTYAACVAARRVAVIATEKKMKIARRAAEILKWVPGMVMICVGNTVAAQSADEGSDIDFVIVAKKELLWFVRLASVTLTLFAGLRITKKTKTNKIDLSFYLADTRLNLSDLRFGEMDIYFYYWMAQLIPIYDPDDFFRHIMSANTWVRERLPHATEACALSDRFRVSSGWVHAMWRCFWNIFFFDLCARMVNRLAKKIQAARIEKNFGVLRDLADTRVMITDEVLKFHTNDHRVEFFQRWKERIFNIQLCFPPQ